MEIQQMQQMRTYIFEHIKSLVASEYEEIFRIIRKKKESYSENSNGIFFDLSTVSLDTLLKIKEYIDFCIKTRQDDQNRLKDLETIRIHNETYKEDE
jgi:hypothetical protein